MFFADPEQVRMNQMATRHEIQEFIDSLDKTQLSGLTTMLNTMLGQDTGALAAYYMGTALQVEKFKFGACGCGMEHETVEDVLGKTESDSMRTIRDHPFTVGPGGTGAVCTALVADSQGFGAECGKPSSEHVLTRSLDPGEPDAFIEASNQAMAEQTREKLCHEYNVEFEIDGHTVRCLGCGLQYVSLRDRMLKAPDDCHGCHLKSANG